MKLVTKISINIFFVTKCHLTNYAMYHSGTMNEFNLYISNANTYSYLLRRPTSLRDLTESVLKWNLENKNNIVVTYGLENYLFFSSCKYDFVKLFKNSNLHNFEIKSLTKACSTSQ